MDYLFFAKFIAYESLQKELLSSLNKRKQGQSLSGSTVDAQGNLQRRFQWTGETVNLIEVAHGIYLNGQVNEGELGINEFFFFFFFFFFFLKVWANSLGFNLGVPKSGFDDLKARKRLSKTHFTDRMRAALLKKMEDEDAYDPHKANNRK